MFKHEFTSNMFLNKYAAIALPIYYLFTQTTVLGLLPLCTLVPYSLSCEPGDSVSDDRWLLVCLCVDVVAGNFLLCLFCAW